MTELKAGTRGTWGRPPEPCTVIAGKADSSGYIVVKTDWTGAYELGDAGGFTPEPEPPTTVMVPMRADVARWIIENADDDTATAAAEALKKAGLK